MKKPSFFLKIRKLRKRIEISKPTIVHKDKKRYDRKKGKEEIRKEIR